jgi:hypothetical protein
MTDECQGDLAYQILNFVVLQPLSFVAWGFIGFVYLFDKKHSLPPGNLIAAEAFTNSLRLLFSVAIIPMSEM